MIYEFKIATATNNCDFLKDFNKRLEWIKQKGYSFHISTNRNNHDMIDITISLKGKSNESVFRDEDIIYIFKHQISEVLAEHIINDWELKLLRKEINRRCKGVLKEDKEIVYDKSSTILRKYNDNDSLNLLMNFGRKNRISHKIFDYMNNDEILIVEGFINFCMPDYLKEIKFTVDLAIEELKNEKEYNEFVKLLRYFVNTQAPKLMEVNLMMKNNGRFYMWDENGKKIEEKYLNYYLEDIIMEEINLDDVLISILITIAPKRLILHNIENFIKREPVEMIKNVFQDRIKICTGCERCNRLLHSSKPYRNK
jgi:putative sporulation protein YtxC